jgi:hypothetical protein
MLAMNVTRRVSAEISVCSVGQVAIGPLVVVGVYPYFESPELVKTEPKEETSSSSEFTRSNVTTSLGLASIHVLIAARNVSRDPPSRRLQDV